MFRCEIKKRAAAVPDPILKEMENTLAEGKGFEDVNLYVASLSECPDSLAQWRAYGGPASGFSLGFDADDLDLPSPFRLAPCIYEEKRQCEKLSSLVLAILDELHRKTGDVRPYVHVRCRAELHKLALVFKHWKFAEERE